MTRLETSHTDDTHVVLGKLTSPYGVKGWLKVYSYTNPMDSILDYPEWWVRKGETLTPMPIVQGRRQGKGLVVQLKGVDDRDAAEALAQADIVLPKSALPELDADEYYWHELEGLAVFTQAGERLGRVSYLFETGANDVMVVRGDENAIDKRERLLPFLPDDVIVDISLENGRMVVDWDSEF
ncbi:ribosome maturation factor RimM [Halomonas aquamarina]|uniref:Ribosome maturation factor RimM n=1 Tax=Vreelandella aquamarina TaxID=77097 RepID=A0ACC5VSY7_9GAMM|nr:ribosome maturation factor RimM [Halomonas aquamarina]MBZ5486990.1 ribosome maturation factor RimM [Halomonas aquamarina]